MNRDIGSILHEWPYDDQEGLQVRQVEAEDGRPLLHMRIDMGLIQMEMTGRPDGARPHGDESCLVHYQGAAEKHRADQGWYEGFEIDAEDCAQLQQEALQYYHRRVACLSLQQYQQAMADADHNLGILDLLKAFAVTRDDWVLSEQYRAFILSHRIQAEALLNVQNENVDQALTVLQRGLDQLREVFVDQEREDKFGDSVEAAVLTDLQHKLEGRFATSHRQRLEIRLDDALRREDVDEVAELRAQLREIGSAET